MPDYLPIRNSDNNVAVAESRERHAYIAVSSIEHAAYLSRVLVSIGYSAPVCHTESELIALVQYRLPEVILMDVDYEGASCNGYQIGREIRATNPDVQILYFSSRNDIAERLRCVQAGGLALFPFDVDLSRVWHVLHGSQQQQGQAIKALIVDDSPTDGFITSRHLKHAGIETATTQAPYQVQELLESFRPDVLILDLYMPECTGSELAEAIRMDQRYVALPIIFLSSERNEDRQMKALYQGGVDFLTKPFRPEQLVQAVQHRATRSREHKRLIESDGLSGLLNHTTILDVLDQEMNQANREGHNLSFAMIDIDHFKAINDSYGHITGDRVIQSISSFLRRNLRSTDRIGRYGGEEFCVILTDTDSDTAQKVIDRLRVQFSRIPHLSPDGDEFSVTFSAGVVGFEGGDADLSALADQALYKAKQEGRNKVVKFENPKCKTCN